MPVQSKIIVGRPMRPPPIPAPKPILKKAITAWGSPTRSYLGFQPNDPVTPLTPSSPNLHVAVLRSPVTSGGGPLTPSSANYNHETNRNPLDTAWRCTMENGTSATADNGVQNGDDGWSSSDAEEDSPAGAVGGEEPASRPPPRPQSLVLRQISGGDALRECEDHTDWVNEVFKRNNLPLITDLRRSIGDGQTLPTLLGIISGTKFTCIKRSPQTKEDRIYNLLNCLKFFCKRGVDITHIDPRDLEDGNLKESLLLLGNIRKHFKTSYTPTQNGHAVVDHVDNSPSNSVPTLPPRSMPGAAMKLPGSVPTPFLHSSSRDPSPRTRNNQAGSPRRRSAQEELLPGVLGGREPVSENNNKTHSALISTTELGTNGVAQHGVEERRQHLESSGTGTINRGILVRHPNGKTGPPVPQQEAGVPQAVTHAWTASPRLQQRTNVNGKGDNSVEDRLKQLIKSTNQTGQRNSQVFTGDGMFHGGGSEVFDDGEIFIVPPPKSRNSPDFEIMMAGGDHSYGPGYRPNGSQPAPKTPRGYVPSKPAEKQTGPRGEVLFNNNNNNKPTIAVRNPRQQFTTNSALE